MFDILKKEQFYASIDKCVFWATKVLFLGYMVSTTGISVDPSKVESIRDWPVPNSITVVHSFHGLASFYRRFILHFSSIAAPLTDCIKGKTFQWNPEAQQSFERLKSYLLFNVQC